MPVAPSPRRCDGDALVRSSPVPDRRARRIGADRYPPARDVYRGTRRTFGREIESGLLLQRRAFICSRIDVCLLFWVYAEVKLSAPRCPLRRAIDDRLLHDSPPSRYGLASASVADYLPIESSDSH